MNDTNVGELAGGTVVGAVVSVAGVVVVGCVVATDVVVDGSVTGGADVGVAEVGVVGWVRDVSSPDAQPAVESDTTANNATASTERGMTHPSHLQCPLGRPRRTVPDGHWTVARRIPWEPCRAPDVLVGEDATRWVRALGELGSDQ
jgi:hypothetical protein